MIRQRLQINNNSKKRYGPPTMKQALYEQRYSNTWIDYEKRLHQLHKKKKHKISPKQLLINDKKFNLVKSNNKLREHGNKYQNPILTCENYKPLVWKNNIPFLPEHENQGAKLENQNRRFLSWHRSEFPKK